MDHPLPVIVLMMMMNVRAWGLRRMLATTTNEIGAQFLLSNGKLMPGWYLEAYRTYVHFEKAVVLGSEDWKILSF
jgi:hypothetical protein